MTKTVDTERPFRNHLTTDARLWMRKRRRQLQLTQKELGARVGLSRHTIMGLELNGYGSPETINKAFDFLEKIS